MNTASKEQQIMAFLNARVFSPILTSAHASDELKRGIRYTIMRMNERDAVGMVSYFWAALHGTEPSINFAARMRHEGFDRFEEVFEEFRLLFDDAFLRNRPRRIPR